MTPTFALAMALLAAAPLVAARFARAASLAAAVTQPGPLADAAAPTLPISRTRRCSKPDWHSARQPWFAMAAEPILPRPRLQSKRPAGTTPWPAPMWPTEILAPSSL